MYPDKMRAAAIDNFGGPEQVHTEILPIPRLSDGEVLIEVKVAGVGAWDPWVISGELGDKNGGFPRVFGSDGAGTVIAVGSAVKSLKVGDPVYGWGFGGEKGGFFAEYVAKVARIPEGLPIEEAGALAVDGVTGLEGLDALKLKSGATILIIGASGGAGHIVCQLARRRGLKVFAIASGDDGVELCRRLGCEGVADGKSPSLIEDARAFCPDGYDGALVFAGSDDGWEPLLTLLKEHAPVAYPHGVEPEPKPPSHSKTTAYDGEASREIFQELNELIVAGGGQRFHVNLMRLYPLDECAAALRDVGQHHVGKLAVQVS